MRENWASFSAEWTEKGNAEQSQYRSKQINHRSFVSFLKELRPIKQDQKFAAQSDL
jgi:hypothetical protein